MQVHPILRFLTELGAVGTTDIRSARESYSKEGICWGRSRLSMEGGVGMALMVFIILRVWWFSGMLSMDGRLKKDTLGLLSFMPIIIL